MSYMDEAKLFVEELPYRQGEYAGRNWGHPWHSLCSYHGKLKPAIAHLLIQQFTKKGDIVLDPLCGVGTIPFEACLQGRIGIGNDLSRMAYAVTKAKVEHPKRENVDIIVKQLEEYMEIHKKEYDVEPPKYSNFGFNGKIPDYFHKDTYHEVLAARDFFKEKDISAEEAMVLACFLHVLHGNRPYALSRNSHPLTPYKPTGEYVYKKVVEHIKNKIALSYKKIDLENMSLGKSLYGNFNDLNMERIGQVDAIITSPPFAGSIKFYIQNWMRLWCVGWEDMDFKSADEKFLEAKQKKSMDIYYDFFEMCDKVLKPNGKVILHLGNSKVCNMADELEKASEVSTNADFNEFLKLQAKALRTADPMLDAYADKKWATLQNTPLEFTITRENYSDEMTETVVENAELKALLDEAGIVPVAKDFLGGRVGIINKKGIIN